MPEDFLCMKYICSIFKKSIIFVSSLTEILEYTVLKQTNKTKTTIKL